MATTIASATSVPEFKDDKGKKLAFGTKGYQDAFEQWSKSSDAKDAAGKANADLFINGQKEVTRLTLEWAEKNGVKDGEDLGQRGLLQKAHGEHEDARGEAFTALNRP
ncbi:hypothetical protein ACZ90_63515 [Streptomyces albus subsp. albus]|nr:hypothetical protein ACZ90_63515 [Streptomyces albus subsp. albus]